MPSQGQSMMGGGMPPMNDPNMGGMPPMDNIGQGQDMMGGGMPPMDDQDMGNDDQDNQFGNNFDAGVEADEDTDPKRYIQQLTGKLSQKLNSYNGENSDSELSKYVGKMIVKAVAKGMDDNSKKDLIKTINTTNGEDEGTSDEDGDMSGMGENDDMGDMMNGEMPINEYCISKKRLHEMLTDFSDTKDEPKEKKVKKTNTIYTGKVLK